ncbi:MAG: chromate transporter, partial [Pseudomonadota bacterium]
RKAEVPVDPKALSTFVRPGATAKTIAVWLGIWFAPLVLLWLIGGNQILIEIALFFSKLAVVTFGGAYAVLAFMAQDVVASKGWLDASEMVDGLGLAETTPGPLILVTQFVGFLAAEKAGGFWLGVAGATTTLWVTFAPCFLWIFAGAPYIDWISSRIRLRGALSAITAAVVGVILNLSVWFAITVLFQTSKLWEVGPVSLLLPRLGSLDIAATMIAVLSGVLLLALRWNMLVVIAISGICGLGFSLLPLP